MGPQAVFGDESAELGWQGRAQSRRARRATWNVLQMDELVALGQPADEIVKLLAHGVTVSMAPCLLGFHRKHTGRGTRWISVSTPVNATGTPSVLFAGRSRCA